jgi:branched-subunit amino acid transport protein
MTLWASIAAIALISFAIKAVGPAMLGARELPVRARGVVALLAPALIGALVVTGVLGPGWDTVDTGLIAGVAAAATGYALRLPALASVVLAIATAALIRASQ